MFKLFEISGGIKMNNSLDIPIATKIVTREESECECNEIITQDFNKQITDKDEIINTLLGIIDSININSDSILIKLNKSLLIQAENIVLGANNLNIQLAGKRLELQPRFKCKNKKLK